MYGSQSNRSLVFLLPRLKPECDIPSGGKPGDWNVQTSDAFNKVAFSLDYEAPGATKTISSVPTMWARPLTLEMILYDSQHPLRRQMVEQWQGMLAAIALAEMRGLPLKAQLVELGSQALVGENFAESLYGLKPDFKGKNLYTLNNKHPWQDIYVFVYDKKPVGMTSPSTLVVPSEEGIWDEKITWWNASTRRLQAPQSFLNQTEQALLWGWLRNLTQELNKYNGHKDALNIIKGLIGEFQASLRQDPDLPLKLSTDPEFFGVAINRGALVALNYPVKAPEQPSSVRLVSSKKTPAKHLLIIDPKIETAWNENPQNIWIHDGKTLASLRLEELATLKTKWTDVIVKQSHELFLGELYFIDLDNALPGALIPLTEEPLIFNNRRITPLIPLDSILLDYFTPEELVSKLKFQPIRTGEGIKIRLIVDLPLSGNKPNPSPKDYQNFRLYKDYDLTEENSLGDQLPVLQVWPNFQADGWKEYYAFYYDAELGEATFKANFPQAQSVHKFKEGMGNYQMARLETFPEYASCLDGDGKAMGLILLKSPETLQLNGLWQVGVDFGTSFTNVYVQSKDTPDPLNLDETLQLQITNSNQETRLNVLFENFIPEEFIPQNEPLPLSSVLTTRGIEQKRDPKKDELSPLIDGRIYVPDNRRFKPRENWIKTDLKWSTDNRPYSELFLKHLALHITALAAKAQINQIQWSVSYPSAYSRKERNNYANVWGKLTEELQKTTGISQQAPEIDSENFRTESLVFAQYFADHQKKDLIYTTCIDMGGGTSDISIWETNKLLHQCSVQLAGRDIFSQIVALKPKVIEDWFDINLTDWQNLRDGAFNAKLDVWLRLESENWLKNRRKSMEENEDFQGLIQITAIGIAGLYYYIGILLKVLNAEKVYQREKITPVYIGGNASRFLKWLDSRGKFDKNSQMNDLLSQMLSAGSGFEDTIKHTVPSEKEKDEAACGLVYSGAGTRLDGWNKNPKDDPLIAGEACKLNEKSIEANQRLVLLNEEDDEDEEITAFKVLELQEVPKFLYKFRKALKQLEMDEFAPLKNYTRSLERDKNRKLWEDIDRELEAIEKKVLEEGRLEPPFILGLKALLKVLARAWAEK